MKWVITTLMEEYSVGEWLGSWESGLTRSVLTSFVPCIFLKIFRSTMFIILNNQIHSFLLSVTMMLCNDTRNIIVKTGVQYMIVFSIFFVNQNYSVTS